MFVCVCERESVCLGLLDVECVDRFSVHGMVAVLPGFRVQGSGFRVQGSGFRVQGSGFRMQGSGFRFQGSGFRVQGSVLRVHDLEHAP